MDDEAPDGMQQDMSKRSVEIMSQFRPEIPVRLNDYCCFLEDACINSTRTVKDIKEMNQLLLDEEARLRELVNNEDGSLLR